MTTEQTPFEENRSAEVAVPPLTPDRNPRKQYERWRRSVSAKLVTIALASVVVAAAAVATVMIFNQKSTMKADFTASAVEISSLAAKSIAGAIRWGKSDIVKEGLGHLVEDSSIDVVAYSVIQASGKSVVASDPEAVERLGGYLKSYVDAANPVVVQHHTGDRLILVVPGGLNKEGALQGAVAVEWTLDRLASNISSAQFNALIAALSVIVLIGVALRLAFVHMIARPLVHQTRTLHTLASGDVDFEVANLERRDEIGGIARAISILKANEIERTRLVAEHDAASEKRAARHARMDEVVTVFTESSRDALESVTREVSNLDGTANVLGEVATQADRQANEASSASQNAVQHAEQVASAAEELSSSVAEISSQVNMTKEAISKATQLTDGANGRMSELAETAKGIGEVVVIINKIAEQTNLLALNATIEAARAGEFGKGFAVVAHEVKDLADQTAKATEVISNQIRDIRNQSDATVVSIGEIDALMRDVNEMSTGLAAAVEEQHAATSEISQSIHSAAEGARSAAGNTTQLVEAVGQSSSAAGNAREVAQGVASEVKNLRSAIDEFIAGIRD